MGWKRGRETAGDEQGVKMVSIKPGPGVREGVQRTAFSPGRHPRGGSGQDPRVQTSVRHGSREELSPVLSVPMHGGAEGISAAEGARLTGATPGAAGGCGGAANPLYPGEGHGSQRGKAGWGSSGHLKVGTRSVQR